MAMKTNNLQKYNSALEMNVMIRQKDHRPQTYLTMSPRCPYLGEFAYASRTWSKQDTLLDASDATLRWQENRIARTMKSAERV